MSLLVLIFAFIELAGLIKLGQLLGGGPLLGIILLTATLGLFILQTRGRLAFTAVLQLFLQGKVSIRHVLQRREIIPPIAAFLLILPGPITDVCGMLLLVWFWKLPTTNHTTHSDNEDYIDVEYHVDDKQ